MPEWGRRSAIALGILLLMAPEQPGIPARAATSAGPNPQLMWVADTSVTRLPPSFQGHDFLPAFDALAATDPVKQANETPQAFRARIAARRVPRSWFVFRIDENLHLEYGPDSQLVACRLDLRDAHTDAQGPAGAKALVLHTEIRPGPRYSAQNNAGGTVQITTAKRDERGLLLVTNEGGVGRFPASLEQTFGPGGTQPSSHGRPLWAYAVCRITPLSADGRAALNREYDSEPKDVSSVRFHTRFQNRFRYLCANLSSIWLVDAGGALVHKQAVRSLP